MPGCRLGFDCFSASITCSFTIFMLSPRLNTVVTIVILITFWRARVSRTAVLFWYVSVVDSSVFYVSELKLGGSYVMHLPYWSNRVWLSLDYCNKYFIFMRKDYLQNSFTVLLQNAMPEHITRDWIFLLVTIE